MFYPAIAARDLQSNLAGLKKNLWKYHLAEVKDEKHIFSNAEVPKGYLEIKGLFAFTSLHLKLKRRIRVVLTVETSNSSQKNSVRSVYR